MALLFHSAFKTQIPHPHCSTWNISELFFIPNSTLRTPRSSCSTWNSTGFGSVTLLIHHSKLQIPITLLTFAHLFIFSHPSPLGEARRGQRKISTFSPFRKGRRTKVKPNHPSPLGEARRGKISCLKNTML